MKTRTTRLATGFVAFFGLVSCLSAQTSVWTYATGQNTAVGQVDSSASGSYRYSWANEWGGFGDSPVYAITPTYVGNPAEWSGYSHLNYGTAPGSSKWTGMMNGNGRVDNIGTYTFSYNFSNNTGASSGVFDMLFLADSKVTDIKLNNFSIFQGTQYQGTSVGNWTTVTALSGLSVSLLSGQNNLQVVVQNDNFRVDSPKANMGLAAQFNINTVAVPVIPEASTSLLSIIGSAACCFLRRRKA